MGQIRYGSATTTHAVRAAIQRSQASTAALSRELGINPKTVAKWRKRHRIENMFGKLKDWRRIHTRYDRRIHTRYDRCAHTFLSAIAIAAIVIFWI